MLIFSTNSEIDTTKYSSLFPYISRSYAMEYLSDKGTTKQHLDYFWNEKGEKIMKFTRMCSSFSKKLLGMLKARTGVIQNITERFAICLSLKDQSPPNPEEFDEK